MRKLIVFNNVTLDGYFTGADGDLSWAHAGSDDPEFSEFIAGNASGDGTLLLGRVTYDLMVSYWPTPMAAQNNSVVAERMNAGKKLVVSRSMDSASWNNTVLVKGDLATEIARIKAEPGPHIVILGSGSIVAQLAPTGLIDEYQIVLNPIVLGAGRTMFEGLERSLPLKLAKHARLRQRQGIPELRGDGLSRRPCGAPQSSSRWTGRPPRLS